MTFSKSSFFAGVGSVFAAIVIGFAGGAMITGGAGVQPPNRVERVAAGETLQKSAGQPAAVANTPAPEPAMATAPVPASDPQPVAQRPAPAAPATASNEAAPASKTQRPPPPLPVVAKGDDAPPRNDQANDRAVELKKAAERKRAEERKFAERRKRQDIEQAANAIRQMKRDGVIDQVVQREEAPRFGFFGNDDN
jgi:ribonuclease E